MLPLYKKINDKLHYWQIRMNNEPSAISYFGEVGTIGQVKSIKRGFFSNFQKAIDQEVAKIKRNGYFEADEETMISALIIEYEIDEMGAHEVLEKQNKLQSLLDKILMDRGLGNCYAGPIKDSAMEIHCIILEPRIAKKVIEDCLQETEFDNYRRIYGEFSEDNHPIPEGALESIDVILLTKDKCTHLLIVALGYLDDSEHTQDRVLRKINNYVEYINHKEFKYEFGEPSFQKTFIRLMYNIEPHPAIFNLIESMQEQVHSCNASIVMEKSENF